jgi:hypothetical protein
MAGKGMAHSQGTVRQSMTRHIRKAVVNKAYRQGRARHIGKAGQSKVHRNGTAGQGKPHR